MFKSLITITLRSLSRQGVFSFINILGLSIGLAVVLLISLLNFYELSFDSGFKEGKNIYRINAVTDNDTYTTTANALGPAMQEIPEVISTVRVIYRRWDMMLNENPIQLQMVWADKDFFSLFETPFILGSPEDVMSRPNVIALSESEAKKHFGNNDPIGQMFVHTIWKNTPPLEVVAVYKDYPKNSSLCGFKIIAPFMYNFEAVVYRQITWVRSEFETFCLLVENANPESVNAKIRQIVADATNNQLATFTPQLQRFKDIYLHSKKYANPSRDIVREIGDIERVKMMSLLSVIILLVACINYMNLNTARAQKRSREIGISKTVGAVRIELILRLTLETAIFTFVSLIIAYLLAWGFLPVFNNLMGISLNFGMALQPLFLCFALLIWVVTTLLASSYPALYMSGFPPLTAIRSQSMPGSSHAIVRKALTVGQFAIAIVLIAWALIIQEQIKFINNKYLGYNHHNLIGITIHDDNPVALFDELKSLASVEMISRETRLSNFFGVYENILYRDPDDKIGFPIKPNGADPNYVDFMQMKFIAGGTFPEMRRDQLQYRDTVVNDRVYRTLSRNNATPIILNRAAVDYLGITPEEAIGKRVMGQFSGVIGYPEVCGVIENYHFESLHRPVGGVCIHFGLTAYKRFMLLRVVEGNLQEQIKTYEKIYKKYFPNNPFNPRFIDKEVDKLYEGERRTARIAVVFSILAIFIASMGVFGLTAFMVEQRTKEVGIRKVAGANVWNIMSLLTSDYVKLLCVSLIIAIPAAWWVCERYLQNFAYRISISWWIFIVAALITVMLTLLTVGALAMKASMADPVKSLKTE